MHINHELMKQSNRSRILNMVYQKKTVTRQEISRRLNISLPTVVSNVADMIEEGILEEAGMAISTGGRKPVIIQFVSSSRYAIGVELKASGGKMILTNLNSEVLDQIRFNWDTFMIDNIMQEIAKITTELLNKNNISKDKLLGIGFAIPGVIDEETLYLENAPTLGLENIDLNIYQSLFEFPIYMENEANTAAYAEAMLSEDNDFTNLIFLSITEGIGTGIVIQNQLYKGNNKKAGEFGHMRISMEEIKCSCGRYGCWEVYASEHALKESYKKVTGKKLKIEAIMEQVKKQDPIAKEILESYIKYLVLGIENIILCLAPQSIVIGGRISQYETIIMPLIQSYIGKEKTVYDISKTNIICSKLGKNASILGASLLPIHDLFYYEKIAI